MIGVRSVRRSGPAAVLALGALVALVAVLAGCEASAGATTAPASAAGATTPARPSPQPTPSPWPTLADETLPPLPTATPEPPPDLGRLPAPGTTFKGKTSQGTAVVLTVGSGPTLVRPTRLTLSWKCSDGTRSEASWELGLGQREPLVAPAFDLFVGFEQGWHGTFDSPTAVSGTGRFRIEFTDISGEPMTCDSGDFDWSAKATAIEPPSSFEGPIEVTTLQQAIAAGYVEVEALGTGASSGDSIVVNVSSRVDEPLDLELPEGSELRARGKGIQDMVVRRIKGEMDNPASGSYWPADSISLDPGEAASYLLEAYCLDFHAGNPQASDEFAVRGPASSRVTRVLRAADAAATAPSIPALQAAIWAITDDVPRAELRARFPASAADIRVARALIAAAGLDPHDYRLFR